MHRSRRRSFGRTATSAPVAFDASVIVRAVLGQSEGAFKRVAAVGRGEPVGVAPDLVWLEVGSAFAGYVRRGQLSGAQARRALAAVLRLPLRTTPSAALAAAAFAVALDRGLSVYDACYAVVAEVERAVLVTADRRLAEAVSSSELLG
jgi:predicted nucleic acid-binding protein